MVSEGDICKVSKRTGSNASGSSRSNSQTLPAEVGSLVRVVRADPGQQQVWCRDTNNREGFVLIANLNIVMLASEVDRRLSLESNVSDYQRSSYSEYGTGGRASVRSGYVGPRPTSGQNKRNSFGPRLTSEQNERNYRASTNTVVTDDPDSIYGDGEEEYGESNDIVDMQPSIPARKSHSKYSTREREQRTPNRQSDSGSMPRNRSMSSTLSSPSVRSKSRVSSDGPNTTSSLSPGESSYQSFNEDPIQGEEEPKTVQRPKRGSVTKNSSTQTSWIAPDEPSATIVTPIVSEGPSNSWMVGNAESSPFISDMEVELRRKTDATIGTPSVSVGPNNSWMVGSAESSPFISDLEVELRRKTDASSRTELRFSEHSMGGTDASSEVSDHEYAEIDGPVSDGEDDPDYVTLACHPALIDRPGSSDPFADVELRRHSSRPSSGRYPLTSVPAGLINFPRSATIKGLPSLSAADNSRFTENPLRETGSWFSRASAQSTDVPAMFSLDTPTSNRGAASNNISNQLNETLSQNSTVGGKRLPERVSTITQASQTSYGYVVADLDQMLATMGPSQPTTSSSREPSPSNSPEVLRKNAHRIARVKDPTSRPLSQLPTTSSSREPSPSNSPEVVRTNAHRIARVKAPTSRPLSQLSAAGSQKEDLPNPPRAVKKISRIQMPRGEVPAPDLTTFSWYVGNTNRHDAQKILTDPTVENETFLVRKSDRVEGYVISIRTSRDNGTVKLRHRKIRFTKNQYSAWSPQGFFSIPDLVEAHCSEKGGHKLKIPFDKDNFVPSTRHQASTSPQKAKKDHPASESDSEKEQLNTGVQQLMLGGRRRDSSPLPSLAFTGQTSSESESNTEENKEGGDSSNAQLAIPWRTPDQWVLQPGEVKRLEMVSQGRCGELWKAHFKKSQTIIAMKLFNPNIVKVKDFVTDTSVLRDINHSALAKMLGVFSDPKKTFLLIAYFPLGSIRDYFSKGRKLTTEQQQVITSEVAAGMEYLSKLDFTHRDLAARNVLLVNDLKPKITDYGLSRLIKPEMKKQLDGNMFWKWLAPEVLGPRMTWSSKSDVWSYGVFRWELYTSCSKPPYPDISTRAALTRHLESGYRLPKPDSCSGFIFEIMNKCWDADPTKRITFSDIQLLHSVLLKY